MDDGLTWSQPSRKRGALGSRPVVAWCVRVRATGIGGEVAVIEANGREFGYCRQLCQAVRWHSACTGSPIPCTPGGGICSGSSGSGRSGGRSFRGYAPTQVPVDGAYKVGALTADAVALQPLHFMIPVALGKY